MSLREDIQKAIDSNGVEPAELQKVFNHFLKQRDLPTSPVIEESSSLVERRTSCRRTECMEYHKLIASLSKTFGAQPDIKGEIAKILFYMNNFHPNLEEISKKSKKLL
ncbi:MAG: hypothetical protein GY737_01580 [Desulfobacteraceae bacterium]|nr:hypothetical protein [Desulfobacteraceae bacterium]